MLVDVRVYMLTNQYSPSGYLIRKVNDGGLTPLYIKKDIPYTYIISLFYVKCKIIDFQNIDTNIYSFMNCYFLIRNIPFKLAFASIILKFFSYNSF